MTFRSRRRWTKRNRVETAEDHHRRVLEDAADEDEAFALAILRREPDAAGDRVGRLADVDHLAVDLDGPAGPRQLAEDHLGELGAPGAHEAGEADDLAGADLEVDCPMPDAA